MENPDEYFYNMDNNYISSDTNSIGTFETETENETDVSSILEYSDDDADDSNNGDDVDVLRNENDEDEDDGVDDILSVYLNFDSDSEVFDYHPNKRFELIICDLYDKQKHGYSIEHSSSNIEGQFLVLDTVKYCKQYSESYNKFSSSIQNWFLTKTQLNNLAISVWNKIMIDLFNLNRIYSLSQYKSPNILTQNRQKPNQPRNQSLKLDIAETFILTGQEKVAIKKTFWISIIQRTWRKIYKEKLAIIKLRCCSLSQPPHQFDNLPMPCLKGMLWKIKEISSSKQNQ